MPMGAMGLVRLEVMCSRKGRKKGEKIHMARVSRKAVKNSQRPRTITIVLKIAIVSRLFRIPNLWMPSSTYDLTPPKMYIVCMYSAYQGSY